LLLTCSGLALYAEESSRIAPLDLSNDEADAEMDAQTSPMAIDEDNDEMFPEVDTKHTENTTPPSSSEGVRITGSGTSNDNIESASSNQFKQHSSSTSNGTLPSMTIGQGNSSSASNTGHGHKFVHPPTGYTWSRDEDAPGYAWKNKKAQEEYARAMDQIQDKDKMIKRKSKLLPCCLMPFPANDFAAIRCSRRQLH